MYCKRNKKGFIVQSELKIARYFMVSDEATVFIVMHPRKENRRSIEPYKIIKEVRDV